jgi:hypothetical protein
VPPPRLMGGNVQEIESPRPTPAPEQKERRKRPAKDRETDSVPPGQDAPPKRERKKRVTAKKPAKDEQLSADAPKPFVSDRGIPPFRGTVKGTPEPSISNGSGSSNRPSPPGSILHPPTRIVDDDYDEPGVAETLMGLASYRAPDGAAASTSAHGTTIHSPGVSSGRGPPSSPRPSASHRNSVSSSTSRSRHSSPSRNSLKRQLSMGPEEMGENKRSRISNVMRKQSPTSTGRRTPVPSTRPSPIPFRTQPTSHSPEILQAKNSQPYPTSPLLPVVLPPHPRPIGAGLSSHNNSMGPINLPPIATLPSIAPHSPPADGRPDDQMQIDSGHRSVSPPPRSNLIEVRSETSPKRTTPSPSSSRHSHEKMETST